LDDKEIRKARINFSDDDIFWTLRAQQMTNLRPSRKQYYEMLKVMERHSSLKMLQECGMYPVLFKKYSWINIGDLSLLDDEVFLQNYVNYTDKHGESFLKHVCSQPYSYPKYDAETFIFMSNLDKVKKLLSYGAKDVDEALLAYCIHGQNAKTEHPIIELLVKHGADVNKKYGQDFTLLMSVRSCSVIKVLLELGADVTLTDIKGRTAIDLAYNDAIRAMLQEALPDNDR
jgi:hypothetical protein